MFLGTSPAWGQGYVTEWDKEKNVLWKVALPGGCGSTPAVWGDRIFVTSPGDGKNLVFCFDRDGEGESDPHVPQGSKHWTPER